MVDVNLLDALDKESNAIIGAFINQRRVLGVPGNVFSTETQDPLPSKKTANVQAPNDELIIQTLLRVKAQCFSVNMESVMKAARELRISKKLTEHVSHLDIFDTTLDSLSVTSNQTSCKLAILGLSTTNCLSDIKDDVKQAKTELLDAIHALGYSLEEIGAGESVHKRKGAFVEGEKCF